MSLSSSTSIYKQPLLCHAQSSTAGRERIIMSEAKADILVFDRRLVEERNYWVERLHASGGPSNIQLDYPRPDIYNGQKAIFNASLGGEVYQKLKKLTGDGAFLLYATQMAALKVCLHKYTGEPLMVVASPPRQQE